MPMLPDFDGSPAEVKRARTLARVSVESDYEPDPLSRSELTVPSIPLGSARVGRYNEIQVARYNRYLQKLLSMKGEVPAPQLASEIGTQIILFHGLENRYLEGWDRFGATFVVAPQGAGTTAAVRFRNPTGSNVIAVFEQINISNEAPLAIFSVNIAISQTVLAGGEFATGNQLDPRGRKAATVLQSAGVEIPGLFGIFRTEVPLNSSYAVITTENQEIPLLPGSLVELQDTTVNQGFGCSFIWRERLLEDSERA